MVKKFTAILLVFLMLSGLVVTVAAETAFTDVPQGHWAEDYIQKLHELGITDGVGQGRFGLGQTITRAEFAAFICKLMKWHPVTPSVAHFSDVTIGTWYFSYIETALAQGAVKQEGNLFSPNTAITREEMAVLVVRALGYDALGQRLSYLSSPFPDVTAHIGYITMAKDLGIINGITAAQFAPAQTATREQAAAMLVRMYDSLHQEAPFQNGFYAISSFSQADAIGALDAVCFGWSRLEREGNALSLNATSANQNEYRVPDGYADPFAQAQGKQRLLMAAVREADSAAIIGDANLRRQAAELLAGAAINGLAYGGERIFFDGLVIDFETLKGEQTRRYFNEFLSILREKLPAGQKKIYVAVHPARRPGLSYYDGYDYKTIGELADKVILMAHDYEPKTLTEADQASGVCMTPLAPLDEVYYALKAICDPESGVADKSKILLQISFGSAQWKLTDGKTVNQTPYTPLYSAIAERMRAGAESGYDEVSQSPYISFASSEDGTRNVVWYEDTRSVAAKRKLAGLFGIGGVSYWRLGLIPDFEAALHLDVLDSLS